MSNYTYSFSSQVSDMSSYVAVSGRPESNYCCVFGLTPQELRYLKVHSLGIAGIRREVEDFIIADRKAHLRLDNGTYHIMIFF